MNPGIVKTNNNLQQIKKLSLNNFHQITCKSHKDEAIHIGMESDIINFKDADKDKKKKKTKKKVIVNHVVKKRKIARVKTNEDNQLQDDINALA
jgi:hypothetical protein